MTGSNAQVPVLLVYFNRPEVLRQNLLQLSTIKPRAVYLASDGARPGNSGDAEGLERCHELAAKMITWDCAITTLRSQFNLGVDGWVPTAIDWFFSQVEGGIILEDDCLVSTAFFDFAAELLARYRHVPQVMNISAPNFQRRRWGDGDYYFSSYPSNWGWATWRRAWQKFDPSVEGVEQFLSAQLPGIVPPGDERRYWGRFFRGLRDGRYTYWDAKWVYSIWKSGGLCITPNVNLASNIGFGSDATHTRRKDDAMGMQLGELAHPLRDPSTGFEVSRGADRYLFETRYRPKLSGRIAAAWARLVRRH